MAAAAGVGAARGDGDGLRERSPHHEAGPAEVEEPYRLSYRYPRTL